MDLETTYRETKDQELRNELILKHVGMIILKIKEEFLDIALISLIRAVDQYPKVNHPVPPLTLYIFRSIKNSIIDNVRKETKYKHLPQDFWQEIEQDDKMFLKLAVNETINVCCDNDLDKIIFHMKLKEYNDRETAICLKKSTSFVTKRRNQLYIRFRSKWNES